MLSSGVQGVADGGDERAVVLGGRRRCRCRGAVVFGGGRQELEQARQRGDDEADEAEDGEDDGHAGDGEAEAVAVDDVLEAEIEFAHGIVEGIVFKCACAGKVG